MEAKHLSIPSNLKLGLFHLGSGMADVLTTGVWNRIMISDLGFQATPIGLLVSLRYFLAPLSVWAGRMSDQTALGGYRRMFWIGLGRLMMGISMLVMGFITAQLVAGASASVLVWVGLTLALGLFSLGNAFSGSTFLALIYDRTPEHQRGRAVGIVWTFLLTGFAVGGAFFGILLPSDPSVLSANEFGYSAQTLLTLFVVSSVLISGLWVFSMWGAERRNSAFNVSEYGEHATSFRQDMQAVLNNHPTRMFMGYLILSMLFAFSQDLILEPFAADVLNMSASVTSRFSAYWGTTAIIGSLLCIVLSRRWSRFNNTLMSKYGIYILVIAFGVFAYSALAYTDTYIMLGLLALGVGLGMWNIGTLGLMMEMSPDGRAGTYLGFWTLVVTLARGVGVSGGGILRDLVLGVSADLAIAYGVVFAVGAVGLIASYLFLMQTDARAFRIEASQLDTAQMIGAGLD